MKIKREPALLIGTIVSIIIAVARILAGDEIISPDQADAVTNLTTKLADVVLLLLPVITGALIRPTTTPVAEPSLPAGTPVLNPADPDGDTPPPDLIVARREDVLPRG